MDSQITKEIQQALHAAVQDGTWGQYLGPHVARLEAMLAEQHGVRHAFTCCSGTFAVELALRAVGVQAGDEVMLAGYDFPGNFRAIEAIGARPVLVDIERSTWCLCPRALEQALHAAPPPRAVVVSHLHGGLADMPAICQLARQAGAAVVEDACQATGARIGQRMAGTWGNAGVLSFGGSKLLSAGRGGALLTDDDDVLQRAKIYCERGNHAFPLSQLQAIVLVVQLNHLAEQNARRAERARRLHEALGTTNAVTSVLEMPLRGTASFYKLAWLIEGEATAIEARRERLLAAAIAQQLPLGHGFRGFMRRSARRCRRAGALGNSQTAAAGTILLDHKSLAMAHAEFEQLIEQLRRLFGTETAS